MEVLEAIRTRRSIRSFKVSSISDDHVVKILEAARWAPSGGNRQPWTFIYVRNPQVLRMVKNCSPGLYGDVAAAIVICVESAYGDKGIRDAGFAAQNMLLAAHAIGLGACVIGSFQKESVRRVIEVPDGWEPVLIVAFGYADKIPLSPTRKPFHELVSVDTYGRKWERLERM